MPDDHPAAGTVPAAPDPMTDAVTAEILAALSGPQKVLPARLFYDEAGCALFNRITELPEYYVTRAEVALLDRHAAAIASHAPAGAVLVEYGASDEGKGLRLLDAKPGRFAAYAPIDIAPAALAAIADRLRVARPDLPVHTIAADFTRPLDLLPPVRDRPAFGFFPGSTIGNFRPEMAVRFLRQARDTLAGIGAGTGMEAGEPLLVVGTDLCRDPGVLIPAYDDDAGVTAAFNRNILHHVNRLAGADFESDAFSHRAIWNVHEGRIEMHLQSRTAQSVRIAGRTIAFAAGETIHTEDSYKHTREGFEALADRAGWRSAGFWTDPLGLFGMHLLRG